MNRNTRPRAGKNHPETGAVEQLSTGHGARRIAATRGGFSPGIQFVRRKIARLNYRYIIFYSIFPIPLRTPLFPSYAQITPASFFWWSPKIPAPAVSGRGPPGSGRGSGWLLVRQRREPWATAGGLIRDHSPRKSTQAIPRRKVGQPRFATTPAPGRRTPSGRRFALRLWFAGGVSPEGQAGVVLILFVFGGLFKIVGA